MEALQLFAQYQPWTPAMSDHNDEAVVYYDHQYAYPSISYMVPMPSMDPISTAATQYSHSYEYGGYYYYNPPCVEMPQQVLPIQEPETLYTLDEVPEHGAFVDPAIIAVGKPMSEGSVGSDHSIMETSTAEKEHFQSLLGKLRSSSAVSLPDPRCQPVDDFRLGADASINTTSMPDDLAKLFESDRRSKGVSQQQTPLNPDAPDFVPGMNPGAPEFLPPGPVEVADNQAGMYVFRTPEFWLGTSKAVERMPGEKDVSLRSRTLADKMEKVGDLLSLTNAMGLTLSDEDVNGIVAAPMLREHTIASPEPEVQSAAPAEEILFTNDNAEVVVKLPWHMVPCADIRADILKNIAQGNSQPAHRVVINLDERALEGIDDELEEPLDYSTPSEPRTQYYIPLTAQALNESINASINETNQPINEPDQSAYESINESSNDFGNMVMPLRFQLSESWTKPITGYKSPPSPLSYVESVTDEEPDDATSAMEEGEDTRSCPTPEHDSDDWSVFSASMSMSVSSLGDTDAYCLPEHDGKEAVVLASIAED